MHLVACAIALAAIGCSFKPGSLSGAGSDADAGDPDGPMVDAPPDTVDPLIDTDGDGVFDGTDNCVTLANLDQRDFDMDSAGDACDACPHLPNENSDTDGDNVGNACDPQPTVAAETRVLWTTFDVASDITGWLLFGQFAIENSKLVHTTSTEAHPSIATPTTFQKTYAAMGVVLTQNATNTSGIGLCTDTIDNSLYYCCELREGGTNNVIALSDWNGGGGTMSTAWTGTFAQGSRYQFVLDTLGSNECSIREGSSQPVVSTSPSNGPHDGYVFIYVDYARAEVEYLFVVETQ